jgi:hypothetical protein
VSAATLLAAARRREESTMLSSCRITRLVLEESTDTGVIDLADRDPSNDVVLESPCKLTSSSQAVFALNTEGLSLAEQQLLLDLPVASSAAVRVNDAVVITDGGPDAALTGERFRIAGVPLITRATARRFPVEHVA